MSRPVRPAGIALVLALAACTQAEDGGGGGGLFAGGDACGAADFEPYVGQRVDALNDVELPEDARVLFPGSAATMDARPDRLNIDISAGDTVTRVYCG